MKKCIFVSVCIIGLLFISACSYDDINEVASQYGLNDVVDEVADEIYDALENADELASMDEEISDNHEDDTESYEEDTQADVKPEIEQYLVPFDIDNAFSYSEENVCAISDDLRDVVYNIDFSQGIPDSDDDNMYLFELSIFENEDSLSEKTPIDTCYKDLNVSLKAPYKERFLFSRFIPAIFFEGEYVALSNGQYISNPEILARNTEAHVESESKKGILFDANTIDSDAFYDLNANRVAFNIPLSYIMGESENKEYPSQYYRYNGRLYSFNGYLLAGFDSLFKYFKSKDIHVTAIILNDWNSEYPEIIHPKSRKRTGKSLYYAMNTEEEDGVRLVEATALFLAERYSGKDGVLVHDWVIANEINQQKMWNYMDTSDLDYYTESFEKSFRIFYNAIRANYSEAKVYFSLDHDWNDNYGNNSSFFNGRDLLYKYNEYAKKGGNYDWNVSFHPYPAPLTKVKFWNGSFDKTEEAGVVTPMNLSSLTDVLVKDEFRNTLGEVRDVAITELGFSSRASEKLQAAAFAYSYYIIENNEYISSYIMNRQTDDKESLKSGLALGIYNNDYSPKYIKDVFSYIDSKKGEEYISEMLEIIGADSFEDALDWAR